MQSQIFTCEFNRIIGALVYDFPVNLHTWSQPSSCGIGGGDLWGHVFYTESTSLTQCWSSLLSNRQAMTCAVTIYHHHHLYNSAVCVSFVGLVLQLMSIVQLPCACLTVPFFFFCELFNCRTLRRSRSIRVCRFKKGLFNWRGQTSTVSKTALAEKHHVPLSMLCKIIKNKHKNKQE